MSGKTDMSISTVYFLDADPPFDYLVRHRRDHLVTTTSMLCIIGN